MRFPWQDKPVTVPAAPVSVKVTLTVLPRAIEWTRADAAAWAAFRKSATWAKIEAAVEDSILADFENPEDHLERLKAYIAGRRNQMRHLAALVGRDAPIPPDAEKDTAMPAMFEET